MIEFHYELDFSLPDEKKYVDWITRVLESEGFKPGQLTYIFCDDKYLLYLNRKFLDHDFYTDIITFDYTVSMKLAGDIFISVERIMENAMKFSVAPEVEWKRVMIHGILHLMGYGDKEDDEVLIMRIKEEEKMNLFHVEQ